MKLSINASAAAILALTAGTTLAAPCNTSSGKDKSANVEPGSRNLAGGQQPASPGTVGAMNNVGADQGLGQKQVANTVTEKAKGKEDQSAKNTAGGEQPASPGTVGALNNAGSDQGLGKKGDDC